MYRAPPSALDGDPAASLNASPPWSLHLSTRESLNWPPTQGPRGVADFAGSPTLAERRRLLAGCRGTTKCGFMAPTGYDTLARKATLLASDCEGVVLTAIFGRKDKLQQPAVVPPRLDGCFFAFVDHSSKTFLAETAPKALLRAGRVTDDRIGAWHLLVLDMSASPYPTSPRRASRVRRSPTLAREAQG